MASNEVIMTRFKEDAARAFERLTPQEYADCVAYATSLSLSEGASKKGGKKPRSSRKGKEKAAVSGTADAVVDGTRGTETTASTEQQSDRIRPTVADGGDIVVTLRNADEPNGSLWLTKTTGAAAVGQGLEAPGVACTKDGCECQHTPWPTSGVLNIRKCNIVCEVCGLFSSEFGIKNGKGAANLRRHVTEKHCTTSTGRIHGKVSVARLYDCVEKKQVAESTNEVAEEEATTIDQGEASTAGGSGTTNQQPETSKRQRSNDEEEGVPGPSTKKTKHSKTVPAKGKASGSKKAVNGKSKGTAKMTTKQQDTAVEQPESSELQQDDEEEEGVPGPSTRKSKSSKK